MPKSSSDPFKGYRFPREIISHAVWLYYRFSLSLRDVEELLAYRGIEVSYQTISEWEETFGPLFADVIRRNRPRPGDKWFLDEVEIKIKGEIFYLWRAVDQHGDVLDVLVQKRRNKREAKSFLKKLVKVYGCDPRVMITDKLHSYGAAKKEAMQRFKSPHHAQRFCSAHDQINTLFRPHRHRLSAKSYRHARNYAFALWDDFTNELTAA